MCIMQSKANSQLGNVVTASVSSCSEFRQSLESHSQNQPVALTCSLWSAGKLLTERALLMCPSWLTQPSTLALSMDLSEKLLLQHQSQVSDATFTPPPCHDFL